MRYKVVRIRDIYDLINKYAIKDSYIEVDKLMTELSSLSQIFVSDIKPNMIMDVIETMKKHLDNGGAEYVKTQVELSKVMKVSRATLNEWNRSGIIYLYRYGGYDINSIIEHLEKYVNNKRQLLYKD